ncbi:acyltransferase domain-containing protein, partial [Streptomyces sp. NPDC059092]|uniref:acyltransferase domain-containing protein n=1 Tax=Streptomyces sp. NPDC059092 TaxID=3346725 RepID=UPI003695CD99
PVFGSLPVVPVLLSARTPTALRDQAQRLADHLHTHPHTPLTDIAHTTTTRSTFEHRAVLITTDRDDLITGLQALAHNRPRPGLITGTATNHPHGVTWIFPGQGSQWPGMALNLLNTSPLFAQAINECEQALSPLVDWSLHEVLQGHPNAPGLDRVDVVQPVLFAIMVSLARLWRALGIHPTAVVGHSQGEIAAACAINAITLQDATTLIVKRSLAIAAHLAGKGAMASLALPAEKARTLLTHNVEIAAINGPNSVVISGEPHAVHHIVTTCQTNGTQARTLPVDYASHTTQVDTITHHIQQAAAHIHPTTQPETFYSTITGQPTDTATLTTDYWINNLRQPVLLHPTIQNLTQQGHHTYLEISPHPVLTTHIQDTTPHALTHGTLRRNHNDITPLLTAMATLHVHGTPINWTTLHTHTNPHTTNLPTYPFQHKHYWLETTGAGDAAALGQDTADHPLLRAVIDTPDGSLLLTGRLSQRTHPWLTDHRVRDTVLLPGTAMLEMA